MAGRPGRRAIGSPGCRNVYRYLLIFRFALLNAACFGVLGAAWLEGWLDAMLEGSARLMCLGIFATFLIGLALCAAKIVRTSLELNQVRDGRPTPGSRAANHLDRFEGRAPAGSGGSSRPPTIAAEVLRYRMANDVSIVGHIANTLVFLGLIGTVIGFIVALAGVDPAMSGSVHQVAPMVSSLIEGMGIALHTTLAGAVLHVWLIVNHRMLTTGVLHLYNAIVELGERSAVSL